ncbi:MAG: NAD(P)/FAD-dependent oxidoreductase [Chloroflexota bacterium]
MSTGPAVVIVGAGALGLATAWHLTRRGDTDVTVIERRSVASASSGLSVGIIETQYLDPLAIAIRVESMRAFGDLERTGAIEIVRNGYLRLGHRDEDLEAFGQSVAIQHDLGVSDCRVLDKADLVRLVPDLFVDDLAGGLFGPSDGYVDGHAYCEALAAAVRANGGRVLQDNELVGCDSAPGDRLRLTTTHGTLDCDVVVNAAGGWATRVGEILGAPVEILPQRHQALMGRLESPLDYVMPSIMDYVPASGGFGVYIRDDGPGRFIAGLHTEEVIHDIADPDFVGRDAPDEYVGLVGERLAHRLPGLEEMRLGDVWAGIYPMRPDGRPVVGPHPGRESVVTVAGAGGSGLQSSPALGQLASEWILDGHPVTIPAAAQLRPGPDESTAASHP